MTRARIALLVVVLLALGGAVAYGTRSKAPVTQVAVDLKPLQIKAALPPCPTGLSPELPDLTLACLGGGPPVSLRGASTGKPTLVNVYGSWCGPCAAEIGIIANMLLVAQGKVNVVGIDTEDDPKQALNFAIDLGQTWPAVVDDNGIVSRKYGGGAPKMIFVDEQGHVRFVLRRAYRTSDELYADIKTHLGVQL